MDLPHWLGIPAVILLIGVIVYGFRQGTKVPPSGGGGTNNQNDYPPPG
jgi:hypothetical protein